MIRNMSAEKAIDRLREIYETRVLYTNGAAERILSEMDSTQHLLAEALGIYRLAEQVGTTASRR